MHESWVRDAATGRAQDHGLHPGAARPTWVQPQHPPYSAWPGRGPHHAWSVNGCEIVLRAGPRPLPPCVLVLTCQMGVVNVVFQAWPPTRPTSPFCARRWYSISARRSFAFAAVKPAMTLRIAPGSECGLVLVCALLVDVSFIFLCTCCVWSRTTGPESKRANMESLTRLPVT
jgi:hypothetical protein